jgi:tRNA(His) 5'-end guanylyltransferase
MKDDLGNRMKENYENRTRYFLPRRTYTIIRLDGKAFHTFTRGMKKPFDQDFIDMMDSTAQFLCEEIQGAQMAYVQSDEISILLTDFDKITTDSWFDSNLQKMASVSASMAAAFFNNVNVFNHSDLAFFDARVFTIPDPVEVENYFVWRQKDAVRNSIAMTAQSLYSHRQLEGVTQIGMQDLIVKKGQNWNDQPDGFKRGRTIYQKKTNSMSADSFDQTVYTSKEWVIITPDFLKEREVFKEIIPRIIYE